MVVKTIEFTDEEYDTMYESVSDYISSARINIRANNGYQNKQNYWVNERDLAQELMDKLTKLEEESL